MATASSALPVAYLRTLRCTPGNEAWGHLENEEPFADLTEARAERDRRTAAEMVARAAGERVWHWYVYYLRLTEPPLRPVIGGMSNAARDARQWAARARQRYEDEVNGNNDTDTDHDRDPARRRA